MTRRKTAIAFTGAAAAAALVLASCAGSGSSGDVTYWSAFYAPQTEDAFQEIFVDGFNAESDVKVDMEVKELTTLAQLTDTAVAAGEAADVIYSPGPSSAADFARADRTLDLGEYSAEYGWEDKILPWAYELGKVDGTLTSVPTSYGSMVLYYNAKVFEENGWTPPTTLAEFESIAAEAADLGMVPLGGGNAGYQAMSEWLLTAVLTPQSARISYTTYSPERRRSPTPSSSLQST